MAECRPGCGACCIAPSISSPLPGMPGGKPANVRCVQLTPDNLCAIYGLAERPAVCCGFVPEASLCGNGRDEAMRRIAKLERDTASGEQG